MDELATFFVTDTFSRSLSNDTSNSSLGKIRSKSRCFDEHLDCAFVNKNYSAPSFDSPGTSSAFPQSNSCPVLGVLPLNLPPEPEEGNIEYKLKLINPTRDRLEHLMTQMKWRLNEGGGHAIYRLGVDDNGIVTGLTAAEMSASLFTLYMMAQRLHVDIHLSSQCTISKPLDLPMHTLQRKAVEVHAKWKTFNNQGNPDIRIAMLGSMDVGKSTLLGILTDGKMDDGRGRARLNIFSHLHEVLSGRTSCLSSELLGFDADGHLINRRRSQGRLNKRTVDEVIRDSNHLITVIDMAGHLKYQRTTLSGLTTYQPAFCLLVVAATTGLVPEGLSHARIAAALGVPIVVVLSKVDLVPNTEELRGHKVSFSAAAAADAVKMDGELSSWPKVLQDIRGEVLHQLKSINIYSGSGGDGARGKATELRIEKCFKEEPRLFAVSSVSGFGMDKLLRFLADISSPQTAQEGEAEESLVECSVTRVFSKVPGVDNPVLEVLVKKGQLCEGQRLWLGPDEKGYFHPIRVLELRHNRHQHRVLYKDQLGSVLTVSDAPERTDFPALRKGMVLINASPTALTATQVSEMAVCWSFSISHLTWLAPSTNGANASGASLQHNSTVGVHCGSVLQYARVLETTFSCEQLSHVVDCLEAEPECVILRLDTTHKLVVTFLRMPEFLELGRQVVISVNNVVRAVGTISGFRDVVTAFLDIRTPSPSSAASTESSPKLILDNSWGDLSNSPLLPSNATGGVDDSYESLLSQIGIDPTGPRTHYIGESPPPPEVDALEEFSNVHQRNKRRQRTAKRRRKAAARLAAMAAAAAAASLDVSSSEVTSSTSTWNSNYASSVNLLAQSMEISQQPIEIFEASERPPENGEEEEGEQKDQPQEKSGLKKFTSDQDLPGAAQAVVHCRKKRKRKHRH